MSPHPTHRSRRIVAVDTGGTFTDFILFDEGRLTTLKLPSTPSDPSEALLEGVRRLVGENDTPFTLLHGSTVVTNALLERKGARVKLVTNRGFEDVLEIGRQDRPQLYALVGHRSPPLVDAEDRWGIAGRLDHRGEEVEPLEEAEVSTLAERVGDADAIAIVLLHSYANPAHEEAVERALAPTGRPITRSSKLLPEYREYERTATTVANAYVHGIAARYLGRVVEESGAHSIRIMGSNGGALSVEGAVEHPIHTVLSGPAGGVVGARALAGAAGFEQVITFDMGGTSTDVSLCPGRILHTREFSIDRTPIAVPMIDIHTVGAGGGSLARVDAGGALRVGPESAGAVPGPICYGQGGEGVTVTDAHVWLGRLPVEGFLGGERRLDRDAIADPLRKLAEGLDLSADEAAAGIVEVANSAMERALRVISVERGFDPKEFVVVAFGGAGGLHVAELTERLGASSALVPPHPGLLSAYGILTAPIVHEATHTLLLRDTEPGLDDTIESVFDALTKELTELRAREGFESDETDRTRIVEARYLGQSFELGIDADGWRERFHRAHENRYGYARRDATIEVVTLRVRLSSPGESVVAERPEPARRPTDLPDEVSVHSEGTRRTARLIWRDAMETEESVTGPTTIVEYSGTTWIPAGWIATMDPRGTLHLTRATDGVPEAGA